MQNDFAPSSGHFAQYTCIMVQYHDNYGKISWYNTMNYVADFG
jgi:hypothetical protein